MSLAKETLEPSTANTFAKQLACGDPYCPKASDPFTNRVICRCYQSGTAVQMQMYPNFAAAFLQTSMHGEIPSPVSSPMQTHPNFKWDNAHISPVGLGSPYPMISHSHQNVDNILRSQMYSYMHSGMDPNSGRRKNATRETTAALKAWLKEHKKNPYPTKAEKIMLAIITRMTLTQVSTWFANARRRLKKEHKGEFSSDASFDAMSTSSDDEDSTKTDISLHEELSTPEHELPGYGFAGLSKDDMSNYASLPFYQNRPLTSSPIDQNMNTLPCILPTSCKSIEVSDSVPNAGKSQPEMGLVDSKEFNTTRTENIETKSGEDSVNSENNNLPQRPKFLPPLISKPNTCKIWSISNIIGSSSKTENNSESKRESE